MKALAKYSFMFIALTATAYAAGDGAHHEPSIKDLMYPAINFAVLAGFLIWKLKKPVSDMFTKQATEVESLMNSAAQKNKDAEERLKTLTAKMANLNAELAKIQSDYESDVASFTAATSAETQATIARTQRDLVSKLEGEKNELVEKLNEELLNNVIAKTQQTISGNSDMKKRATTNIVSGLR